MFVPINEEGNCNFMKKLYCFLLLVSIFSSFSLFAGSKKDKNEVTLLSIDEAIRNNEYTEALEKSAEYIEELAAKILKYQKSYYTGEAEISDAEFDRLWDELKEIAPDHPVLQKVGSDLAENYENTENNTNLSVEIEENSADLNKNAGNFQKARHLIPMGSQEKAANPEQFLAWAQKHPYEEYLVEYKLDGASLEIQYQNGEFYKAVTRGDGEIGDDITRNVAKMQGLVLLLLLLHRFLVPIS